MFKGPGTIDFTLLKLAANHKDSLRTPTIMPAGENSPPKATVSIAAAAPANFNSPFVADGFAFAASC